MKKTIKSRIFRGYIGMIFIMLLLVFVFLIYLNAINKNNIILSDNRNNQNSTREAVVLHYEWIDNLNMSIQTKKEFTGSLNYETCSLGKWLSSIDTNNLDSEILASLKRITVPHQDIHNSAKQILELSKTDSNAAYNNYLDDIKPKVNQIISELNMISNRYKEIADTKLIELNQLIRKSIDISIILVVIAVILAILFGNSISKRISRPIVKVAEWSKKLSMGSEDLDFNMDDMRNIGESEIGIMINSFEQMANSIQENVNVVRKVADGDMTAFVNIRSDSDSLGKNLYRLVQSNDLMFAEILVIAKTVAEGSEYIAESSQLLAESATSQSDAVIGISSTVNKANMSITKNVERTYMATNISESIKNDIDYSNEKMKMLVTSVDEIRVASEKISSVIASIDNIAAQTNLLALNAAIEAARAGDAGKGFAIVANEVRELAMKSANAAYESKVLIDNAIDKTHIGSKISHETSETFIKITDSINEIVTVISDIACASKEQQIGIENVNLEIRQITESASNNAAASEESAAASQQMHNDAEILRQAMSKFNLRKREEGQAYIPPEKQNDLEFIRQANENYRKALGAEISNT